MPLQSILKSSANSVHITGGCMTSGISLIANRNSDTDSVDPCGTPFLRVYFRQFFVALHLEGSVCKEVLYKIG
jgi:hypothetical protein